MTHEELYLEARNGNERALQTLCTDYRALFISTAQPYLGRMDGMGMDDFIQEGWICTWKIVKAGNFDPADGSYGAYIKKAYNFHLCHLWQNYTQKNMVCMMETIHNPDDGSLFMRNFGHGYADRYYTIYAKAGDDRRKTKERQKRWYQKRAAEIDAERAKKGLPKIYRRTLATEAEKAAHDAQVKENARASAKRYQKEHKEEIAAKHAAYYQKPENKERYRLRGLVWRRKKSLERWEAEGDEKRAAIARQKVAEAEAELNSFLERAS